MSMDNAYETIAEDLEAKDLAIIAPNTVARRTYPGVIVVTLHGNPILTLAQDGTISASDAGWPTALTVNRLNQFTPERFMFTRKGDRTYVIDRDESEPRMMALADVEYLDPAKGVVLDLRDPA